MQKIKFYEYQLNHDFFGILSNNLFFINFHYLRHFKEMLLKFEEKIISVSKNFLKTNIRDFEVNVYSYF